MTAPRGPGVELGERFRDPRVGARAEHVAQQRVGLLAAQIDVRGVLHDLREWVRLIFFDPSMPLLTRFSSRCTRWTGPNVKLSSAARQPGARLLFQVVK